MLEKLVNTTVDYSILIEVSNAQTWHALTGLFYVCDNKMLDVWGLEKEKAK
ncbi:MAG: hypothetical protein ACXQT5_06520 [Candidatus Syntropharchaeia archaeon]